MEDFDIIYFVADKYSASLTSDGGYIMLEGWSDLGRSWNFEFEDTKDIFEELEKCVDGFDVSYETYIWLKNDGHRDDGMEMEDILEDSKGIKKDLQDILEDSKMIRDFLKEMKDNG